MKRPSKSRNSHAKFLVSGLVVGIVLLMSIISSCSTATSPEPSDKKPTLVLTSPITGDSLTSTTVTIAGTASDDNAVSSVEVKLDSGAWTTANGTTNWTYSFTAVADGSHTLSARATDAAGNVSTIANANVTLKDLTPLKTELKKLSQPNTLVAGASASMTDTKEGAQAVESSTPTLDAKGAPVTYRTVTQKFKASAAYDTQVLLNPSTDVIYPGSVLLGNSIDDGSYKEITDAGTKRELKISFDLSGVKDKDGNTGVISGAIVPTLDTYRELRNKILAQSIPKQTTTYSMEKLEIKDETELGLKVNAGVTYKGGVYEGTVKAGFSFDKSVKTNKLMVKFMQTFYTVDISQGSGTFLYNDFDITKFNGYRPVYVSSIAYGRLAYLTIESTETIEKIEANLAAMFASPAVKVEADVAASAKFFKENTKTNITVIGGSTTAASLDAFLAMLSDDTFSESNSGKIIAYKLRFVDDNTIANTIFNGEYTVRSTETVEGKGVNVKLQVTNVQTSVSDSGSGCELYGSVKASGTSQDTVYLWSYSEGSTYDVGNNSNNPFNNGIVANYTFPSATTSNITIAVENLKEDDLTGDDSFGNPTPQTYTPSQLIDGSPRKIRATSGSEWVEFTITPTVTYLY